MSAGIKENEGKTMLTVLFNWLYIFFTTACLGLGFAAFVEKKLHYKLERLSSLVMCGLVIATVYAQLFSLFHKVGFLANVVMFLGCTGILLIVRKRIKADFYKYIGQLKSIKGISIIVLVLLWSYFTSRGIIHYDTDLYHAQSIRWIEEYGVVKGLGNLYNRLAYNSAFFSMQALFSLRFALGRSLHSMNGFLVVLMLCYAVMTLKVFKEKRLVVSDLFKLGLVFYMSTASVQWIISSPGSDLLALGMVLYLGAKWSEYREQNQNDVMNYGVLCLLAVWSCTIKLSVVMLVLLAMYPAVELIRKKAWKQIALFVGREYLFCCHFLSEMCSFQVT